MIVAVMQPYFFPYIGYFQLMQAADVFVIYDDAQYMKGGWINRNRIRSVRQPVWLTMPVLHDSRDLAIDQRRYQLGDSVPRIEQRLAGCYSKAPFKDEVRPLLTSLLHSGEANVAAFNTHALTALSRAMDISCEVLISSRIEKPAGLRAQDKIIDLCRRIGAERYVNPVGGARLYDAGAFAAAGIELAFLRTRVEPITLEGGPCHLSIIDHLMMDGIAATAKRMVEYELTTHASK